MKKENRYMMYPTADDTGNFGGWLADYDLPMFRYFDRRKGKGHFDMEPLHRNVGNS